MTVSAEHLIALHGETVHGGAVEESASVFDAEYSLRAMGYFLGTLDLPEPRAPEIALAAALRARRTSWVFGGGSLSLADLATILGAATGLREDRERLSPARPVGPRVYPSGGALYGVETMVITRRVVGVPESVLYYQPLPHRLVRLDESGANGDVSACFSNTDVAAAACILLLTSDLRRPSFTRYGGKQYRLVLLEAGHLAQNVLLVAAGLGLGALPLCGFADQALAEWVGLDYPRQVVLYAIAIGTPDPAEAGRLRREPRSGQDPTGPAGPPCALERRPGSR